MVDMNWYINTKQRIIILTNALLKINQVLSKLVLSQPWMLEHSNLFESYTKLQEIHNINNKSIKNIVRYMKYLDNKEVASFNSDIVDEVDITLNRCLLIPVHCGIVTNEDDVLAIGWEDYLARGAVLFVEWPDRAGDLIPAAARHVRFTLGESEDARIIEFAP